MCVGCPSWKSCCFRVSDPICVAANVLCRTVRGAAYLVLSAAELAYDVVLSPFRLAVAALEAAKLVVSAAKVPFDAAKLALEVGKQTVRLGLKAAEYLAEAVLGYIVDVRSIKFEVGVDRFFPSSISASVDVVFFNRIRKRLSFTLNLKSMNIVSFLANNILPGIVNFRRRRSVRSIVKEVSSDSLHKQAHHVTEDKKPVAKDDSKHDNHLLMQNSNISVVAITSRNMTQMLNELHNQFARERDEVRQQTVDPLSEATTQLAVSWNESAQPEINGSSRKLYNTLQTKATGICYVRLCIVYTCYLFYYNCLDQCAILTLLTRLTKTFKTLLWNEHKEWKYSVDQFSTEVRQHRYETLHFTYIKKQLSVIVASETENLASTLERSTEITEQFQKGNLNSYRSCYKQ